MIQTSKKTPVISGLRTSPFSFDCKEEHLDQHKQKSCHWYERHRHLFRYKQECSAKQMEKLINRKKPFSDTKMLWLQVCVLRGWSQIIEKVADVVTVCPSGGISSKNNSYTSHMQLEPLKKHLNGDENSGLVMISKHIQLFGEHLSVMMNVFPIFTSVNKHRALTPAVVKQDVNFLDSSEISLHRTTVNLGKIQKIS